MSAVVVSKNPDDVDKRRYQSEERHLAIMRAWRQSGQPRWLGPDHASED
jgi:hypothetical protein